MMSTTEFGGCLEMNRKGDEAFSWTGNRLEVRRVDGYQSTLTRSDFRYFYRSKIDDIPLDRDLPIDLVLGRVNKEVTVEYLELSR